MILLGIHTVLLFIVGGFLLWLMILSILSFGLRPPQRTGPNRRRHFAVLIPAHNEEISIGHTIRSIRSVEYPSDAFDVIVIADNCSDDTARIAHNEGALVITRKDVEQRGKGYALRWAFDRLAGRGYHAYAVIDADSTVSRNLLSVLDACLEDGAVAIQCNDQVRPQPGSWSAEAIRAGFLLYNYTRPAGRRVIGFSSGLRGNGMCFTPELLRRVPWSAFTRAEDLEYSLLLALEGIPVTFAPEATVLATMTRDPQLAESQRARWEGGRFPLIKRFAMPLLLAVLTKRSLMILDVVVDLLTPALVNLLVVAVLGLTLAVVQWLVVDPAFGYMAMVWAGVVACGFLHAVLGLWAAGSRDLLLGLVGILPRYVVWKLKLYGKMILRGDTSEWKRTVREPERNV
jgi:1,2-diacylglycerol 3-beta-glucosyltransferase